MLDQIQEKVDKILPSPDDRASKVYSVVKEQFTIWDLICFSGAYLVMISETVPWLKEDATRLYKLIYTAHYLDTENVIENDNPAP